MIKPFHPTPQGSNSHTHYYNAWFPQHTGFFYFSIWLSVGPNEIRAMVETFLEEEGVSNPHIIFARVAGSTGYNLAGGRSDLDFYVVYAAQTAAVLLDTGASREERGGWGGWWSSWG